MKILVVGTCQAPEVGRFMQALLPDAMVEAHEWVTLDRSAGFEDLARNLPGFDIVFAQPHDQERYAALSNDVLRSRARRLRFFPIISFTGLHPDSLYLPGNLAGPMGEYHSGLIVAAYRLGIPAGDVPSLFNALVFSALGYFREAAISRAYLLESAARLGYELAAPFDAWMADGAFLYTLNHPKAAVIETLARLALAREAIEPAEGALERPASHLERGEAWPVYPEIARRLGFEGSTTFIARQAPSGDRPVLSLEEFVTRSYLLYASVPDENLVDSRILQLQAALAGLLRRGYETVRRSQKEIDHRLLVRSLYRAILCREADDGGLEEYASRIDRNGQNAIEEVVAALAHSPEALLLRDRQIAQQQEALSRET